MIISFQPLRHHEPLALEKRGESLYFNGAELDLSALPAGRILPAAETGLAWLAGDIARNRDGTIHLTVFLPHGDRAPAETRYPEPVTVSGDGPVSIPAFNLPAPPAEDQ